ncbi:hypothetical protein ONZ45_g6755 [Pleurotus djamor]|nr:hypothetical protein ONZ45_g6755 [Pleurotus djamor]
MVFFALKLSVILAAQALQGISASPVNLEARAKDIQARADSVTMCRNTNYGGPCVTKFDTNDRCLNVDSGYNDQISSIRVGFETNCIFYQHYSCVGDIIFADRDIPDLRTERFNDVISSFRCFHAPPLGF